MDLRTDPKAGKIMLRVREGGQSGATAFFRNRALLRTIDEELRTLKPGPLRILFHAVSVGAEAYSFLIHSRMTGLDRLFDLTVEATDINANFLAYAARASYPADSLAALTEDERAGFEADGDGGVRPVAAIREALILLPPMSFVEPVLSGSHDVIVLNNGLPHVGVDEQARALDAVGAARPRYLVASGFHPDTIEADLRRNCFRPVARNQMEVYNGWTEHFRNRPPKPDDHDYSYALTAVDAIAPDDYRRSSLFVRD